MITNKAELINKNRIMLTVLLSTLIYRGNFQKEKTRFNMNTFSITQGQQRPQPCIWQGDFFVPEC